MAASRSGGSAASTWARLTGLARAVIRVWALAGGVILVALVLMTTAGAASNLLFDKPFPFDYDLARFGVAIAAFSFLPYCQLTYGNITVDVFTERASNRFKATMVIVSSLLAAGFMVLLVAQMWLGMLDFMEYREVMVSIPVPLWTAFPPALASLVLTLVASLITAAEGIRGVRGHEVDFAHDVRDAQ